ncbi:MAG: hypothetical protein ONB24_04590 [candidate division KSB1 bacterium]|nr:hypothetical protein [candidate division KSB1 bacterium]
MMRKKSMAAMMVIVLLAAVFVMTGCTKYAKQEQLQKLEETKSAALAAEKSLNDCKAETAKLEDELAKQKQALEDMKAEKETVSKRLAEM